jgi:hypothetical protein
VERATEYVMLTDDRVGFCSSDESKIQDALGIANAFELKKQLHNLP